MLTTASFTGNGWKSWLGNDENHSLDGDEVFERELHLKSELTYQLSDAIELKGGIFGKSINSDHYTWFGPDTTHFGFIFPANTISFYPSITFKAGGFLQTTIRPSNRFSLVAGLRSEYFDFTDEFKISPRIGLNYFLTDKLILTTSYGYYYQTPSTYQAALDPANTNMLSSRAIHNIAGLEYLFSPDTKMSIELYQKDLDFTFIESDTTRKITNEGSGYSRGIEFYIQQKMSQKLVGSLAYTYSISKRKDGDNLPLYDFEFDQRHNFTLAAGYKLTNNWRIGLKFQYATGMPYTPATGTALKNDCWYVVEGGKNSARYPDVHKLDIRVDRTFHFNNWTLTAFFDLWNVYNQDNVLYYSFDVDDSGNITRDASYDFSLLPIIGISAQF